MWIEGYVLTLFFSRAGIIIISILSAIIVLTLCAVLVVYMLYFRKRRNSKVASGSFNFTEDIDMGSTFVSRVRSRLSQFTNGLISSRGDRSMRRSRSTWVPTSPTGSICVHNSDVSHSTRSETRSSWVGDFEKGPADNFRSSSINTEDDRRQDVTAKTMPGAISVPAVALISETPPQNPSPPPRQSAPDCDCSSRASQLILGSGYLSTTSTRNSLFHAPSRDGPSRFLDAPRPFRLSRKGSKKDNRSSSLSVPSNSSSGYAPSKSSVATPTSRPDFLSSGIGIYVSSPIRPSKDLPGSPSIRTSKDLPRSPSIAESPPTRSKPLPTIGGLFPASRRSIRRQS